MSDTTEITKGLADGKLVIGTDKVLKGLKAGDVKKVFVTSNAPDMIKEDVAHYAKLSEAEVVELDKTNADLKEICKKQFNISLVGL